MLSVLVGPNYFGLKEFLSKETADFIKKYGDIAIERIDLDESEPDKVINSVQSSPFLATRKLVILSNLSNQKELIEDFDSLINQIADTTDVIIIEKNPDKRSSLYKKIKKLEGFKEFANLDEMQLKNWLLNLSKEQGASISSQDVSYLINRVGLNQEKLNNEFKKLIDYSSHISRENIDELTEPTPQSSIFNLLDQAFSGDHRKTLKLYDDQRSQGVEPLNILGMIAWQMNAIALVDSSNNLSPKDISSASGINPFVVQKSLNISRRLGRSRISFILDKIIELDRSFKTVIIDQDTALKNFLTTLAYN